MTAAPALTLAAPGSRQDTPQLNRGVISPWIISKCTTLNTGRSQHCGRSPVGLGFNNSVTLHGDQRMRAGTPRSVIGSVGRCSSLAVRSIFGRGVVGARRHNLRQGRVIDLGRKSWPVSRVPRHTIHTVASSHMDSEPSASNATTPLLVQQARPASFHHRRDRKSRSAASQVSRGDKERQHNYALQRTHSRGTSPATEKHTARHAARR